MRKEATKRGRRALFTRPLFDMVASDMSEILSCLKTGKPLLQKPESVIHMNSLQVSHAERFIYSSTEDFSLAIDMINTHPINQFGRRPQMA